MRAKDILLTYNISLQRLQEILGENIDTSNFGLNSTIDSSLLDLIVVSCQSECIIDTDNSHPEIQQQDLAQQAAPDVDLSTIQKDIREIEQQMIMCHNKSMQYWALTDEERNDLILAKTKRVNILKEQLEYDLQFYHMNEQDKVYHAMPGINDLNNEEQPYENDELNEEFDDYESENELRDEIEQEKEGSANFEDWGSYRQSHENPWIDVFGPGDEAETAFWNTD